MVMLGRRIGARSRNRVAALMDSNGSLHSDVDPPTPGSDGSGDSGGTIGIDVNLSVTL